MFSLLWFLVGNILLRFESCFYRIWCLLFFCFKCYTTVRLWFRCGQIR